VRLLNFLLHMSDRVKIRNAADTFKQFVLAINNHDVKSLTALMTTDHLFVDSVGNRVHSATSMAAGWHGYFAMCPDYWIHTDCLLVEDSLVLAVGDAGGLEGGHSWRQGDGVACVCQAEDGIRDPGGAAAVALRMVLILILILIL